MPKFKSVDLAFNFLKQNESFKLEELVLASEWKSSTAKGYITKKLSNFITSKENLYIIDDKFKDISIDTFRNLFRQSVGNNYVETLTGTTSPTSDTALKNILKINSAAPSCLDLSTETDKIECKESFSRDFRSLLKPIASFLNNKGGYILYGVKDGTWEICGLSEAGLSAFNLLDIKDVNTAFFNATNIGIEVEKKIFEINNKIIAILYVHPAKRKPVIFIKNDNGISNGQIFYRYPGESRLIGANELNDIIEERTKVSIEKDLMKLLSLVIKNGIENSAILNIETGEVEGKSGNFLIEDNLLDKIKFIKEGEFVEKAGAPALKLVGDITSIGEKIKEIETHISITDKDLILSFACSNVTNPKEYIKYAARSQKKWLPLYYFMKQANLSKNETIEYLNEIKTEAGNSYPSQQIKLLNDGNLPPKGKKELNVHKLISKKTNISTPLDALKLLVSMAYHDKAEIDLELYLKLIENIVNQYWENEEIRKQVCYLSCYLDNIFFSTQE